MGTMAEREQIVVSGARPTGRIHLGNYHGAFKNWLVLQEKHRCLFFVADWHALTTDYASDTIGSQTIEMVLDLLAVGLDPERCTIFQQSAVKAHAELFLILGMLTPIPWLERNPTYKEQREQLVERDLSTYGFLGYPVLQAADVLLYKATAVPVGIDQAPHIELTREIARRFNATYHCSIFPEPKTLLTETPKMLGTDGRKMSKSYDNAVYLTDTAVEVDRKLSRMVTDPRRARRTDPGEPADCPAYTSFHRLYCTPEELRWQEEGCRSAGIGCVECKKVMIKHVQDELEPVRARRARLGPDDARAVLASGNARAIALAEETMGEVREAMKL